jgi:hypothetical protein
VKIETDAPVDNAGRGAAFSPTDLVGAALISCAITTMAIRAPKEGIAFESARGRVLKEMTIRAVSHMDDVLKYALAHDRPGEFLPKPTAAMDWRLTIQQTAADATAPTGVEPH